MYHPFSVAETVKTAWKVLKKNFITLVVYSIISLVINEILNLFVGIIFIDDSKLANIITILIQMLIQSYLVLSFYKLILTLMDKEYYEFEMKEIIPSIKMALGFILIALLYGVLIFILLSINFFMKTYEGLQLIVQIVELCLLLYLLLRSIFCLCFIVDDDSKPFESLVQSFKITKDNFFKTLAILVITIVLTIVTLLPITAITTIFDLNDGHHLYIINIAFYIWFLIVFPMVQVMIMVTYRKLVYSHQDVDDDIAETN